MNDPHPDQIKLPELGTLSGDELAENLRELTESEKTEAHAVDRLQEVVHELQVHRVELEMQNRALRETQAELEQSIQRYSDLYDNLPVGYVTLTPEGRILEANLAAAECLQRERIHLKGVFLRSFLDAYDAGRLAGHLENCAATCRQGVLDITLRLKDGSSAAVQLTSRQAPAAPSGLRPIQVAISDVSKLKQAHRILEEINAEQEAFNYSISHDLRAPLITISNYAGIVLSDHGSTLNDEVRGMVDRMRCAAVRMEQTLKHLLQYSTLAREEITLGPVSVEDVVKELLIEHRGLLQEKHAEISVRSPLSAVRGCAPILNQVLANLLTNAVKYAREGEPPRVQILTESRSASVVLKVIDGGIGIERKYHERVFRIFERLHGYSQYPGSGVGLAIARRAVERMNGRIWVESELGKGSSFCVELPKA